MDSMPRLREFLEAFLAPWHVAAPIAIGSGALLVLRWYGIPDLAALPTWVFGLGWIVFVYATTVLFIRVGQSASALVERALVAEHFAPLV